MDFHFFVMEKSWKINVEKEGAPWQWLKSINSLLNHWRQLFNIHENNIHGEPYN